MEKARVYLVGAGPGDPDLLTVKAARLIASADVVVHDGLVDAAIMALISPSARLISVAKSRSRHSFSSARLSKTSAMEAQNTRRRSPSAIASLFQRRGSDQCLSVKKRRGAFGPHTPCPTRFAQVSA